MPTDKPAMTLHFWRKHPFASARSAGFTLPELLVTISILAILTSITIVAINPVEYIRRGRDSQRTADLSSFNTLITQYRYSGNRVSMGDPNTVYVSLPDSTSTCANLSLPDLPSGWSYRCATGTDYRKTDGTGWLPVNLSETRSFSALPVDPTNDANYYYAYVTDSGHKFAIAAMFESIKQLKDIAAKDNGYDSIRFETGTDLSLWKQVNGLALYLDANNPNSYGGSGSAWKDLSGGAYDATLYGSPTYTQPVAGDKYGITLNGTTQDIGNSNFPGGYSTFSIEVLFYHNGLDQNASYGVVSWGNNYGPLIYCHTSCSGGHYFPSSPSGDYPGSMVSWENQKWNHLVAVYKNTQLDSPQWFGTYLDGKAGGSRSDFNIINSGSGRGSNGYTLGNYSLGGGNRYKGSFALVRFYTRALSDKEIETLYRASK